jgi:allantoate deiminase
VSSGAPAPDFRAHISPGQLSRYTDALGSCGAQPGGGLIRLPYTPAWSEGQRVVGELMAEAGLEVRTDAVGNVFGRLAGQDTKHVVLTGSHVDTVRLGGRFDGALGVLGGIAAVGALKAVCGRPALTIEVVSLCEEEASRFHGNFLGSRAMLGLLDTAELTSLIDDEGVALGEAMQAAGLDPSQIASARRSDIAAFVELHIEQGGLLEEAGIDIGVVTAITGISWEVIRVRGRADHAGTTPMRLRRDAFLASAQMALVIAEVAQAAGDHAVATTGKWSVLPGGSNIVPGDVTFSIDTRHADAGKLAEMIAEMLDSCREIADAVGVELTVSEVKREAPAPTDQGMQEVIAGAADHSGASWRRMPSGAGHDSQLWAQHVPTGMIFVPSVAGRSHVPEEYTPPENCALGAEVLARTLWRLAYGDHSGELLAGEGGRH